jgi:hypothetical protein
VIGRMRSVHEWVNASNLCDLRVLGGLVNGLRAVVVCRPARRSGARRAAIRRLSPGRISSPGTDSRSPSTANRRWPGRATPGRCGWRRCRARRRCGRSAAPTAPRAPSHRASCGSAEHPGPGGRAAAGGAAGYADPLQPSVPAIRSGVTPRVPGRQGTGVRSAACRAHNKTAPNSTSSCAADGGTSVPPALPLSR